MINRATGLMLMICALLGASAQANEIAIGLTKDAIDVDAGFAGARVTLFGYLKDPIAQPDQTTPSAAPVSDIIAVVRGPETAFTVRPIEKHGIIWRAGEAVHVSAAPGLYLTSATRPFAAFIDENAQRHIGLGAHAIRPMLAPSNHAKTQDELADALQGFIDAEQKTGRYRDQTGAVKIRDSGLFSIDVDLPPKTPVGDYEIEVFLFRNGVLAARDSAALRVRKVGFERRLHNLAHDHPYGYGVICVAMSLFAGWLAAVAFRK